LPAQSFILSNRIVICNVATGFTQVAGQLVKNPHFTYWQGFLANKRQQTGENAWLQQSVFST
jgi:hypothetical protein